MTDRYIEGVDYVVCDECGSHLLIDDDSRVRMDAVLEALGVGERLESFTCDWWPCSSDVIAIVRMSPRPEAKEHRREERDAALERSIQLPAQVGDIAFRWVDEYHVQAMRRGRVIAQWWPSRGKTMVGHQLARGGQRRGPRCSTPAEFVALCQREASP